MKAIALLALFSLISCGAKEHKTTRPVEKVSGNDQVKAPAQERLSILSQSPLPAQIALNVNGEDIFDQCVDLPEHVSIDYDVQTIELDLASVFQAEKLQIIILDRGENCDKEHDVYYVNERVDHEESYNKWTNVRTMYARLNNFPREIETQ